MKNEQKRLDRPALREKIEAILEPTLGRLYHQDLPEGKYEEIAIKASVGMLKSNLTTQILDHFEPLIEEAKKQKYFEPMNCTQCGSTVAVSVEDNGFILLACRCRSHAIRYTDIKPEWQALKGEKGEENPSKENKP